MTTRFEPLNDEGVGPGARGADGLVDLGHRHPDGDVTLVQLLDDLGGRTAEGEGDYGGAFAQHELDLRLEGVVLVPRLTEVDAVAVGVRLKLPRVRGERLAIHRRLGKAEDVDAEGRRRQLAHALDVAPDFVGCLVAGSQESERADP